MLFGRKLGEVIRFGATGALCVILNIAIVMFLTEILHLHYLVSLSICFVLVTAVGFVFNRYWTFRKRGGRPVSDYARYLLVAAINLVVSVALCALTVDVFKIPYPIAMALLSLIFIPLTFVLHRAWTFRMPWRDTSSR